MNRRKFLRNSGLLAGGIVGAPYILPSGRLFAATGNRIADHVVFVLFAGGIRNQESVNQQYLATQGLGPSGNVMNNMLSGAAPSSTLGVYDPWDPILTNPLSDQGSIFPEMRYTEGPTGHYNGHTVAMTGNYTQTGLNLNINPESPTVFEYYRKHSNPSQSALNAWWISEGLGPYPSLNYSRDPNYGPMYGANYLRPATIINSLGNKYFQDSSYFQPDDVSKLDKVKTYLDHSFDKTVEEIPGIVNSREDKESIKKFIIDLLNGVEPVEFPLPSGVGLSELSGDLINLTMAWKVMEKFKPELTVVNTFNLDICHDNFSGYLQFLHKADYGVGWLWNKIQSDPELANNTIMICMPEHGRNLEPNSLYDGNGLRAYDHTNDDNSREIFSLVVGPAGVVNQNSSFGTSANPVGQAVDIVPTIAHILGFESDIPGGYLPGNALTQAFV